MLDPVLLELAVLLVEEANRVVGLLLHKVGNLGSKKGLRGGNLLSGRRAETLKPTVLGYMQDWFKKCGQHFKSHPLKFMCNRSQALSQRHAILGVGNHLTRYVQSDKYSQNRNNG